MTTRGKAALLAIVPLTIGLAAFWQRPAFTDAARNRVVTATLQFEATVYQGPDKGLTWHGPLTLQVREPSGVTTGVLKPASGPSIPVTGRFQGATVNLVFTAGNSRIFGVGSDTYDATGRQWIIGGPLVGPGRGDFGDWLILTCIYVNGKCLPVNGGGGTNPTPIPTKPPSGGGGPPINECFLEGGDPFTCGLYANTA